MGRDGFVGSEMRLLKRMVLKGLYGFGFWYVLVLIYFSLFFLPRKHLVLIHSGGSFLSLSQDPWRANFLVKISIQDARSPSIKKEVRRACF